MTRTLYAIHRWISALALIQLAVWTVTGLLFAAIRIEEVHGEHVDGAHEIPIGQGPGALSPATAVACLAAAGMPDASRIELRASHAGLFYVGRAGTRSARIDARSCAAAPVGRGEAEEVARRDQPGRPAVRAAELLEAEAGVEYRSKPLPAWRVDLADEGETSVYVDARTGEVTARRNRTWRTFDFLWSLHIMSYETREGFNHPLILIASSLAVLTVASGVAVWILRAARWIRRRRAPARA